MEKQWYQIVKELREDHDLTQEQVAKVLKTTQQYYGQYELGKRNIPIHQLKKLCEHYQVSADYVLGIKIRKEK